jgi:hypothetical protein
VTMPSEAVWDKMLAALAKNAETFAGARPADDALRLRAALASLECVMMVLPLEGRLATPLGYLAQIVEAAASGQHVKILNPAREAKGPTAGVPREAVQGLLAVCVGELMLAGNGRDGAGQEVASLCRKYKLRCEDGNDPTAEQLIGFRKSCSSGEAPARAREVYDSFRSRGWRATMCRENPELAALRTRTIVQALAVAYPTGVPNRRGRA